MRQKLPTKPLTPIYKIPRHPMFNVLFSLYLTYNILIATLTPYFLSHDLIPPTVGYPPSFFKVKALIAFANIIALWGIYLCRRWGVMTYIAIAIMAILYYIYLFKLHAIINCILVIIAVSLLLLSLLLGKEQRLWDMLY